MFKHLQLSQRTKLAIGLGGFLLFCIGAIAGLLFERRFDTLSYQSFRDTSSDYDFIAPLLFVEIAESESFPEYQKLKDAIQDFANDAIHTGEAEEISIYYRNLNTSQWVAINPEERFTPASMLKVATLIAILEASEEDENLFSDRLRIGTVSEASGPVAYPPLDPIQAGMTYTVQELIEHLIQQSDNTANTTLARLVGSDRLQRIYDELAITPPRVGIETGYTSVEYSRLYRALYNSTYLSRSFSEYALNLLSTTAFTQGIVSGVPKHIGVSHKFGVHTELSGEGAAVPIYQELHDCGIVYYPEHPYFLCVMTRGKKLSSLEAVLAGASRTVWREVERVHE